MLRRTHIKRICTRSASSPSSQSARPLPSRCAEPLTPESATADQAHGWTAGGIICQRDLTFGDQSLFACHQTNYRLCRSLSDERRMRLRWWSSLLSAVSCLRNQLSPRTAICQYNVIRTTMSKYRLLLYLLSWMECLRYRSIGITLVNVYRITFKMA